MIIIEISLKPKFSVKLSPNNTANIRSEDVRLDVNNLYDFNRISANDTVEGGAHLFMEPILLFSIKINLEK